MPYSKPFTLVKHASSTTRYRLLLKKALTFCFRAYRMDAKQRERLIGVRFNKKLDSFLNAIWHHEDLANSPLTALGAYPIEVAGQAQQQAEEMGEMRIEYEDMDIDGSVYEDLGKADDDSEEEEVDDSELSSTSDDNNGDDSGNAFRPIYDKNEEGDLADRPEQGVPLTTLVLHTKINSTRINLFCPTLQGVDLIF
ncbi:hypothetical protein BKA60DRAFT_65313 [Fusarium oxysporum]|nr:hypothetical protein BKA60DRAFT_65313 [Fusarium oxysporum]